MKTRPRFLLASAIALLGFACSPPKPATAPEPGPSAPSAQTAEAPAAAPAGGKGSPATATEEDAENKALGDAVAGLWTPDASGSVPASRDADLERELLKAVLYVNGAKSDPPLHEGRLLVHTNRASLKATEGAGVKALRVPAARILELALRLEVDIHLQHQNAEGGSVFATLDQDKIRSLLARAKKSK